eukprot:13958451-Alexandrium_andersonii.AAC.1
MSPTKCHERTRCELVRVNGRRGEPSQQIPVKLVWPGGLKLLHDPLRELPHLPEHGQDQAE